MANKFTNPQYYTDIANAIRTINGLSRTYTPPQMAQAILDLNIATGEAPELIGLEVANPPNKTHYLVGETFNSTGIVVKALYAGGYYRWVSDNLTFSIAEGYIFTRSDSGSMVITVTYVDEWDGIATASFELAVDNAVSFEVRGYFFMDTGSNSSSRYIDFKIYTEYLKSIKIVLDASFKSNYGPTSSSTWNIYGGTNTIMSTTSGTVLETCTCTSDSNDTIIYENNNLENSEYDWIGFYHGVNRTHLQADTRAKIICSLRDGKTMKFNFKSYNSSQYITDIYIKPLVFYNVDNIVLTNGRAAYNNYNAYDYYNIYTATDTNSLDFDDNINWNERDKNSGIELRHDSRSSTYNVDYLFTYKTLSNISLSSISVDSLPKETTCYTDDYLDLTGLVIKATYSDGISCEVSGYTTSIPNHTLLNSAGLKTITVSYTEKGITRTTTFTINVVQSQYVNGVRIVPWSTGTDSAIAAMVAGAEQGKIDLTNYWHVGDERIVHLSAMPATGVNESHVEQDVTMVLMDANNQNYTYVTTPASGRIHPYFIVQQKNGFANDTIAERGYLNSSSNYSSSWDGCARRTWCNNIYKSALPNNIRNIFHQVKVKTAQTYNSTIIQESDDYFFLPAAAEVFKGDPTYGQGGTAGKQTAYSNLTEFNALTRWEYYATSTNRIKKDGNNGAADYWYTRSPQYNYNSMICLVLIDGGADDDSPQYYRIIAPAGCI